jgi:hypothetical protein
MKRLSQLILFVLLLGQVIGSGPALAPVSAAAPRQASANAPQVLFVTDVSGSMGYYVLSKNLPQDLALMQEKLDGVLNDPEYARLLEQIDALAEDPQYQETLNAYNAISADLSRWLNENGYQDADYLARQLQEKFKAFGCASTWDDSLVFEMESLADAEESINETCKYANLSGEQKQELLGMVAYTGAAGYQSLRQQRNQAWQKHVEARDRLGYEQANRELQTYLNRYNYVDLETRINLRAKSLGYPLRLDLARQTAHMIIDLSRLDLQASGRQTLMALVKFSTLGRLAQPLTNNYDQIDQRIDELGFYGGTNLGDGLALALDEIEQNGDPEQPSAIILLSDGEANLGMSDKRILSEIPPRARSLGARICAVGFSNSEKNLDVKLLKGLADQTGGAYQYARSGDELVSFYTACREGLVSSKVTQFSGLARQGQTIEAGKIEVEQNTDLLTLTLTYLDGLHELVLVDPNGQEVTSAYPGVEIQQSQNLQRITLSNPIPSGWTVQVRSREAPEPGSVFSVVIGSQISANRPGATATSAPPATQTPAPTIPPPNLPSRAMMVLPGLVGAILVILAVAVMVILGLALVRWRGVEIQPLHILLAGAIVLVSIVCVTPMAMLVIRAQVDSAESTASAYAHLPGATPTASATAAATASATPPPTLTPLPSPTPSLTPAPTAPPVVLNPGNITNLALLDTPLDNSVPGLAYTWFYAFDLSPDGQYFATQGYYCPGPDCEDYIKVWQILPDGMAPLLSLLDPNGEEMWDLYTLAFSPDSSLLASGGADQKIRIWSIPEGQLLRTLEGHKAEVEDLDFSPDGELLASASSDNTLRLWRVSDGSLVNTMRQKYEIYDVEFSPDGQSLASGSRENNANGRLWEVSSGRVLRTFSEIENTVLSIAYSPDGGRVAMGTFDGDILVYDARSGNRIARFRAHNGTVASLAFSTDGAILASGGNDQKVHLWSLPDGELLTSLPGHLDRVWHVIFAPQGNLLYTVARYDALRVWGVQP